MLAFHVK